LGSLSKRAKFKTSLGYSDFEARPVPQTEKERNQGRREFHQENVA
jgi:hypothetical protein